MDLFKKISGMFRISRAKDRSGYWLKVKCNRCGEEIQARIDLYNEPSIEYRDEKQVYFCRKVLIGEERCFQQIEITLTFDDQHSLIDRQISGGVFVNGQ